MAEEKDIKQARTVYAALCAMLDERDLHYEKDEENLSITCGAQGDDLPIEMHFNVDPERKLITLFSPMPFAISEERRAALAVAVSQANKGLVDGCFDYDFIEGRIFFRMTSSYRDSLIGKDLFAYMLFCSFQTIDDYNDKFLMVAKNKMSFDEIVEFIK